MNKFRSLLYSSSYADGRQHPVSLRGPSVANCFLLPGTISCVSSISVPITYTGATDFVRERVSTLPDLLLVLLSSVAFLFALFRADEPRWSSVEVRNANCKNDRSGDVLCPMYGRAARIDRYQLTRLERGEECTCELLNVLCPDEWLHIARLHESAIIVIYMIPNNAEE